MSLYNPKNWSEKKKEEVQYILGKLGYEDSYYTDLEGELVIAGEGRQYVQVRFSEVHGFYMVPDFEVLKVDDVDWMMQEVETVRHWLASCEELVENWE